MATPGEIAYLAWWREYEHGHGYDHEAWLNLPQRHKNAWEAAAMANPDPYEYRTIRIPRGTDIDGAVVELHVEGGLVTMDIRIPGRHGAPSGEGRDFFPDGCICAWTWDTTGAMVRNGPRRDCTVHGDEDRIRDAMAEAHDHPGRTVTR
jgi:hypothetical protein